MNATRRPRQKVTIAPRWEAGERVADRTGATGVVASRHGLKRCLVSYDDGRQVVMYDASLHITQN